MRDFESVVHTLSAVLEEEQPIAISPSWIRQTNPKIYGYIWRNIRTANGHIDWDRVTRAVDRSFSKRWIRYRHKQVRPYEKQSEVDVILAKYKDKLYTFLGYAEEGDKEIQDTMVIQLVRMGQRGNISAQEELIKWVTYITDDWLDRYPQMYRWKGYSDEIPDKIRGCIRCYRYTGSFLGYLFRTLEYSARGKPPLVSLDDKILDGTKTRGEYVQAEILYILQ